MRMTRNGLEDLTRLLGRKRSIPLQQSGGMPQRNIQCSNGLRNAVQLNIQSIPADFLSLYESPTAALSNLQQISADHPNFERRANRSTSSPILRRVMSVTS